ncbi:MAG: hypothetical protein RL095_1558 [Verrucomicrobiota bacterium]|jgi:hypothetical protein
MIQLLIIVVALAALFRAVQLQLRSRRSYVAPLHRLAWGLLSLVGAGLHSWLSSRSEDELRDRALASFSSNQEIRIRQISDKLFNASKGRRAVLVHSSRNMREMVRSTDEALRRQLSSLESTYLGPVEVALPATSWDPVFNARMVAEVQAKMPLASVWICAAGDLTQADQVADSPLFAAALDGEAREAHPEFPDIILLDALPSEFNVDLLRRGWISALVLADPNAPASPGGTNPGLVITRDNLEEIKKQHPGLIPGV